VLALSVRHLFYPSGNGGLIIFYSWPCIRIWTSSGTQVRLVSYLSEHNCVRFLRKWLFKSSMEPSRATCGFYNTKIQCFKFQHKLARLFNSDTRKRLTRGSASYSGLYFTLLYTAKPRNCRDASNSRQRSRCNVSSCPRRSAALISHDQWRGSSRAVASRIGSGGSRYIDPPLPRL
jgi:hypothetical protein